MKASWVHVKKPFHCLDEILIPKLVHRHLFICLYIHTYIHTFFITIYLFVYLFIYLFSSPFLAWLIATMYTFLRAWVPIPVAGYKTASQYELYYILYCKLWVNPTNVMSLNDMCDHRTGTCSTTNTFKLHPARLAKRLLG